MGAGFELDSATPCGERELGKSPDPRAAKSGALDARELPIDPDLVTLIDAWSTLPTVVKAKIMVMVREAAQEA